MSHHLGYQPYIPHSAGDLVTAEDWNEMQQFVKADLADNAAADTKAVGELKTLIANVDAPKFGGKTPDDWTGDLDKRYIRRDEPQAPGQYRRYFKQVDKELAGTPPPIEPAVIEHNLCRFPLVEVFELQPLLKAPTPSGLDAVKFLIYYATKLDPIAKLLNTESSDRFYWGDLLGFWLDQFGVTPALTQSFSDLVNDFWGKMFDPGLEQDEFNNESFGNTPYVQKWMDDDKTVGDLVKGGQWDDIRVATRPKLATWLPAPDAAAGAVPIQEVLVYHVSQNAVEIKVPRPMDLMVLLRT